MSLPVKQETKPVLKKHVNTIHCSNNLTLVQRKLFNALLFNAYNDLLDKAQYQISVKRLCELIGYDSRDYKKLRKSILDLITTSIEWNVIDQEHGEQKEKWRASALISAAKIESGMCTYEFSSTMRELLYTPEIYGKIDIKVMIEFKSSYGLALYENCIRFHGIAQTQWLSLPVFRKLMGIPDGQYSNFCDFKKRVLDIAVKEVNNYSPITVIPEIRRVNKKVTSIRFKLSNQILSELTSDTDNADVLLINSLKNEFGFSIDTIQELITKYGHDYINIKVKLIKESDGYKRGKIRGLAGYLVDALKRDYQTSKAVQVRMMSSQTDELDRLEKKELEKKRRAENARRRTIIDKYLIKLDNKAKQALLSDFEHYIRQKDSFFMLKKYKEVGISSPAVRAVFNLFVFDLISKNKHVS